MNWFQNEYDIVSEQILKKKIQKYLMKIGFEQFSNTESN